MQLLSKKIHKVNSIPVYDVETKSENHNFCLSNGIVVHNSKDIADAVAGCVQSLYDNLDKAGQLSNRYKVKTHSDLIKERATTSDSRFQDMIYDIF